MINKKVKFSSLKLKNGSKNGKTWSSIIFTFKDGEEWLSVSYFKPSIAFDNKTIPQQEKTLYNKVKHVLEVLGADVSNLTSENFFEFATQCDIAAKSIPRYKECYIKTKKDKLGKETLADWFPFISLSPDLSYSEVEQKNIDSNPEPPKSEPPIEDAKSFFDDDDDDNDLPF